MTLTVTGRHLVISAAARRQMGTKIRRIERVLGASAVSAQCVVWQERVTFVCELVVHAGGDHQLVGVGRDPQIVSAVTAAVEKVSAQALRLKDKWTTRRRTVTSSGGDAGGRTLKSSRAK